MMPEDSLMTPLLLLQIAARFMIEDDEEQMKEELKEAFRQHNSSIYCLPLVFE